MVTLINNKFSALTYNIFYFVLHHLLLSLLSLHFFILGAVFLYQAPVSPSIHFYLMDLIFQQSKNRIPMVWELKIPTEDAN